MSQTQTIELAPETGAAESRRRFLGKFTSAVFAGLVAPAVMQLAHNDPVLADEVPAEEAPSPTAAARPAAGDVKPISGEQSVVDRMLDDLQRALKRRADGQNVRFGMAVDLQKCTGCRACTIACKAENMTPPEVSYNVVLEQEVGSYPNVKRTFMYKPCFHCENPPCTPVCPVGATYKREEDGIVVIDYDICIGCRYCLTACPYGSRFIDLGKTYTDPPQPYETSASPEYDESRVRAEGGSPVGNARKCHFCLQRIYRGMLPACTETCIGRAIHFGDLDDPDSVVAKLIAARSHIRLKEELGTEPNVYYLV
ncbi:MAG: 4Fe-4S dicluster domain-containing protein [Chloroflexi bacterium]|nr:MAG: 4Fe-4S dicluster domain-containing protein [Chloroflexota bacterium]